MIHTCKEEDCDGKRYGHLGDLMICQHRSKRRALGKRHHKDSTSQKALKVASYVINSIRHGKHN